MNPTGLERKVSSMTIEDTFLYFAYGSNLWKKRIHLNNATAKFLTIGRLDDHCLQFYSNSNLWNGAIATIVPIEGAHVWGAVWKIKNTDKIALDKQEGVHTNRYFAKSVNVYTKEDDKPVECRTYQLTKTPEPSKGDDTLPMERRPSITYLEVIIKGAIECNLPTKYVEQLKKIPNNGLLASPEILKMLDM